MNQQEVDPDEDVSGDSQQDEPRNIAGHSRQNTDAARSILEPLYQSKDSLYICLKILAESVEIAHEQHQLIWAVSLKKSSLSFIIGGHRVLEFSSRKLFLEVDANSLSQDERDWLEVNTTGSRKGVFRTDPAAFGVPIPEHRLVETVPKVIEAHRAHVRNCARSNFRRTKRMFSHNPGVMVLLEQVLGRELPVPGYLSTDSPSTREEFLKIAAARERERNRLSDVIVRALNASGLSFAPLQVATFYTALQTKGFVVLSGISGTGKSKLAQHFADILPQPTPEPALAEDQEILTVRPYMIKYGSCAIPKRVRAHLEVPAPGQAWQVTTSIDETSGLCQLRTRPDGTPEGYIELQLPGKVRSRFRELFNAGDRFILELDSDEDSRLTGVRIISAEAWKASHHSTETNRAGVGNALFLSVRPDWRDSKSLLGYYNPLTGTYEWTPFLRFLMRAVESYRARDGLAWFVILDEMNLAHVEYYFADLLSVLESGRDDDGWTREAVRLGYPDEAEGDLPPAEVRLPPNLYVVGTVNMDETTFAFSPKVLDRAFTIELTEVDFGNYPVAPSVDGDDGLDADQRRALLRAFTRDGEFARIDKGAIARYVEAHPEVRNRLQRLNDGLRPFGFHFGFRVFDEIVAFCDAAAENGCFDDLGGGEAAFDAAVLMKVLPKFHGSRARLEGPLRAVLAWCVDPDAPRMDVVDLALKGADPDSVRLALDAIIYRCPETAKRARQMLWTLQTEGFAAFG